MLGNGFGTSQTCCALRCRPAMLAVLQYSCASRATSLPLATVFEVPRIVLHDALNNKKNKTRALQLIRTDFHHQKGVSS
jgi:hypothetical protein